RARSSRGRHQAGSVGGMPKAKKAPKKKPAKKPAAKAATKKSAKKSKPKAKAKALPAKKSPTKPNKWPVVTILESPDPLATLRQHPDGIAGNASVAQGQVALGAAQLMLLPIAREARGGRAAKELIDLILDRWDMFPERTGFHAQEFLRNAFAAVGEDSERIAQLVALVPGDAT